MHPTKLTSHIDYILVQNRSGINRTKTKTFAGAKIGSDHDLHEHQSKSEEDQQVTEHQAQVQSEQA